MSTKKLVRISLLATILYVIQMMFANILYIEFFNFALVLYGVYFEKSEAYLSTVVYVFLIFLTRGFGIWSIMYLIVFPQYILIYKFISHFTKSEYVFAIVGGLLAFICGTLIDLPFILSMGNFGPTLIFRLVSGLKVSLGSFVCTFMLTIFLLKPIIKKLESYSISRT